MTDPLPLAIIGAWLVVAAVLGPVLGWFVRMPGRGK